MIGATPWVCNYNVPVARPRARRAAARASAEKTAGAANEEDTREDTTSRAVREGRRIARRLSERGGGLPSVQAMALPHGEDERGVVVEIACNLLDETRTGPKAVQAEIARLCAEESKGDSAFRWEVRDGYVTNLTPETILERLAE